MTLIISTVGRCNLSICAIDRLIVQVPRIVKESGMCTLFIVLPFSGTFSLFKVLPFSCFQTWDWAQCQSLLFLSIERWMHLFWIYIYLYICKCYVLYAGFELWYPVDTPLPHFWVSQWVMLWLLRHCFVSPHSLYFYRWSCPGGGAEEGEGAVWPILI